MIERAPFSITTLEKNEAANDNEALESLEAFDAELREHLERHIEQGDFFHLLATYMGFLEETAADPDSTPEELRAMQVRLSCSIRSSLQKIAETHHIRRNYVVETEQEALREAA